VRRWLGRCWLAAPPCGARGDPLLHCSLKQAACQYPPRGLKRRGAGTRVTRAATLRGLYRRGDPAPARPAEGRVRRGLGREPPRGGGEVATRLATPGAVAATLGGLYREPRPSLCASIRPAHDFDPALRAPRPDSTARGACRRIAGAARRAAWAGHPRPDRVAARMLLWPAGAGGARRSPAGPLARHGPFGAPAGGARARRMLKPT
jgi:hypothetical protein